jgi:SAM-dependent methyltransferase
MKIQYSDLKYIAYQRTHYLILRRNLLLRAVTFFLSKKNKFRFRIGFECLLRKKAIMEAYKKDMQSEYNEIISFLPEKVKNILDIGCGIGGIDVFLSEHYKLEEPHFYCLDKTQIDSVFYGFNKIGAFYNSLENTKQFLQLNEIPNINILEADSNYKIPADEKFDLIISLISWGYHFPIDTYLNEVYSHLNNGGHLILDIRENTNGIDLLREKFPNVITIKETEKKIRVLAVK